MLAATSIWTWPNQLSYRLWHWVCPHKRSIKHTTRWCKHCVHHSVNARCFKKHIHVMWDVQMNTLLIQKPPKSLLTRHATSSFGRSTLDFRAATSYFGGTTPSATSPWGRMKSIAMWHCRSLYWWCGLNVAPTWHSFWPPKSMSRHACYWKHADVFLNF
jgi:hypothetical protein